MSATETGRHIGVALKRKEDDPLLRGRASFVDNIVIPGTLTMAVVRSPYAHAKITLDRHMPRRRLPRASSPSSPAPTCATTGRRRCRARGR